MRYAYATAAILVSALGACSMHLREAVADGPTAIATAQKLCNWTNGDGLHAKLQGDDRWHVWDETGERDAYINRYDTGGTYVCMTL